MKPEVAPINTVKISSSGDEARKPPNPILTYKAVDSPSNAANQAPFAAKVAEQLRKSQEQIEGDVYGLDQKSPADAKTENSQNQQATYSLQLSKQHPNLHDKVNVLKSPQIQTSQTRESNAMQLNELDAVHKPEEELK